MKSYVEIDGWKSNIRFSSAHIIPEYEKCGRLHGHTYAVHTKIYGKIDEKGIIIDFSILKEALKQIVNQLDHKILIPENTKVAEITKENENVKVFTKGKKYSFPITDCEFLPLISTSAENLSSFILDQLIKKLPNENIESIQVGVDEGFGQGARIIKEL